MRKSDIIKHIRGESSLEENQNIIDWVNENPKNLKYYSELKNLWINSTMPISEASDEEMALVQEIINNRREKKGNKYVVLYSAAATIIVLLTINIFLHFNKKSDIEAISSEKRVALTNMLFTNKGVKAKVNLPDGSIVWLNSASYIKYPDQFSSKYREVEISGEALFDVVYDSTRPMIVKTNKNFKIVVLGTKFNLRSYENDNEAQTTLFSGKINLVQYDKSGNEIVTKLLPKESFLIKNSKSELIRQIDTTKQKAWQLGKLIFENTPIDEVIKKLERWHGTEFLIKDSSIYQYKLTAEFQSESIIQILEMLKFCTQIDYTISDNKATLFLEK